MKTFKILRTEDVSGVSGTGYVAEGVEFHDGQVCVSWFGEHHIVEVCKDLKTWVAVHGHGGSTRIEYDGGTPDAIIAQFDNLGPVNKLRVLKVIGKGWIKDEYDR